MTARLGARASMDVLGTLIEQGQLGGRTKQERQRDEQRRAEQSRAQEEREAE